MKRLAPYTISLLILFACVKNDAPAPEKAPTPATQTAPQTEPSPAVSPPQVGVEPPAPSGDKAKFSEGRHVVAKGDTLYSIAKRNGLNYRDLAKWNEIEDPRRLRVGQELRLTPPER